MSVAINNSLDTGLQRAVPYVLYLVVRSWSFVMAVLQSTRSPHTNMHLPRKDDYCNVLVH